MELRKRPVYATIVTPPQKKRDGFPIRIKMESEKHDAIKLLCKIHE